MVPVWDTWCVLLPSMNLHSSLRYRTPRTKVIATWSSVSESLCVCAASFPNIEDGLWVPTNSDMTFTSSPAAQLGRRRQLVFVLVGCPEVWATLGCPGPSWATLGTHMGFLFYSTLQQVGALALCNQAFALFLSCSLLRLVQPSPLLCLCKNWQ